MNLADVLIWVLRLFGALYLVGGLWLARQTWFWARMGGDIGRLVDAMDALNADAGKPAVDSTELKDSGRDWWLFAGAVITAASGAAMLIGHRLAVPLLAILIVHQLLYFIRQRRRELRAPNAEAAADARPSREAINGFFSALIMGLLAAWLYWRGALL